MKSAVINPCLEKSRPADQDILVVSSWSSCFSAIRHSFALKGHALEEAVLTLQPKDALKPRNWFCLVAMVFIRAKNKYITNTPGNPQDFFPAFFRKTVIVQPVISMLMILRLPVYFVQQVLGHFVLTREEKDNEFVGFGKGKAVGGIVYWLTIVKKARRYGLFGLAQDTYMGQPLGIHNWPLAVALLSKLGFRNYIYVAIGLFSLGYIWLCGLTGHLAVAWLLPLMVLSTYYLLNISAGTWEPLAWGIAMLCFGAFYGHYYAAAGLLIAALLLTHPGVTLLTGLSLACFALLQQAWMGFFIMGAVAGVCSVWWLVPYKSTSRKLGRDYIINKFWGRTKAWSLGILYQGGTFLIFACAAFIASHQAMAVFLLLPLGALYCNTKIRWIFSGYTVTNYMLFSGAVYLAMYPDWRAVFVYLLCIYTSNTMIWWAGERSLWGFDLTPVVLGGTRYTVLQAFQTLPPGCRVAFEMTPCRDKSWDILPALGYILADADLEALNIGYAEIGDHHIFESYCQFFHAKAAQPEFEAACQKAGIQYFVTSSEDFRRDLIARGYAMVRTLPDLMLSDLPYASSVTLTVFKLPWGASLIEPKTALTIAPNRIRFSAVQGQNYYLKYSAFQGWRAIQGTSKLKIEDRGPGMRVCALHDGEVEIQYAFVNYWRPDRNPA